MNITRPPARASRAPLLGERLGGGGGGGGGGQGEGLQAEATSVEEGEEGRVPSSARRSSHATTAWGGFRRRVSCRSAARSVSITAALWLRNGVVTQPPAGKDWRRRRRRRPPGEAWGSSSPARLTGLLSIRRQRAALARLPLSRAGGGRETGLGRVTHGRLSLEIGIEQSLKRERLQERGCGGSLGGGGGEGRAGKGRTRARIRTRRAGRKVPAGGGACCCCRRRLQPLYGSKKGVSSLPPPPSPFLNRATEAMLTEPERSPRNKPRLHPPVTRYGMLERELYKCISAWLKYRAASFFTGAPAIDSRRLSRGPSKRKVNEHV